MSQNVTFKNSCDSTVYVRVECKTGHSHFTLQPGETHEYPLGPTRGCKFCWSQNKVPDSCKNGTPIAIGDYYDICGEEGEE
jgi:hypothetical protein